MPDLQTNASPAALLGCLAVMELIDLLAQKQVITGEELAQIYRNALARMGDGDANEARKIMRLLLPDLRA